MSAIEELRNRILYPGNAIGGDSFANLQAKAFLELADQIAQILRRLDALECKASGLPLLPGAVPPQFGPDWR